MPNPPRDANVDDAADLAAMRAACFDKTWEVKEFTELLKKPDMICLIIPQTAYAIAQCIPPEAELITIAVVPEFRRQGIAENLLQQIWQTLQDRDIHLLHLEVNEKLAAARALYEKLGFTAVGRRADYYGPGQDAILMRRETPV